MVLSSPVSATRASSLGKYLSTVAALRQKWKVPRRNELWFRAEDALHRKTHLQPGLYRPRESGKRKSTHTLLDLEGELYEEFRRCAPQLSDATMPNDEDWEWDSYFLMQHHGVPTRLLDWPDGALVALHFAVRNKVRPPQSGSIIYALDPYWLLDELDKHPDRKDTESRWIEYLKEEKEKGNTLSFTEDDWERLYLPSEEDDDENPLSATPSIPMLWDSPHLSRRVAAQRSRFMIFGTDPAWLADLAKEKDSHLVSITIPVGAINTIKQELRDAGVTESVRSP